MKSSVSQTKAEGSSRQSGFQKFLTPGRQFFRRLSPRHQIPDHNSKDAATADNPLTPDHRKDPLHPLPPRPGEVGSAKSGNTVDHPNPDTIKTAISQAEQHQSNTKSILGAVQTAANIGSQGDAIVDPIDNFDSTYLQPFTIFNSIVNELANIHPYAKIALSGLAWASQIVINQMNRDQSVLQLLPRIRDVYEFLIADGELEKVNSMLDVLAQMSKQVLECAQFVDKYSETTSFWKRLGKNIVSETDATIQKYNDSLDLLLQKFRDRAAKNTLVTVHRVVEELDRLGQDIRLDGITHSDGAGINTTKTCLDGTRTAILGEIVNWINDDEAERIYWLSGVAGSGKSAISHTIGQWLKTVGRLGSFFCFDRTRDGDRRHEKLFATIARDLANFNMGLRQAIVDAISTDASLKNTVDVLQQWRKLVVEPVSDAPLVGPIVIVIDALDESGSDSSREHILNILADEVIGLPSNFRILLTSRPLPDIHDALHDKPHVHSKAMDSISPESTERDIHLYVSHRLHNVSDSIGDAEFTTLAKKADRLFEWARLACEFIHSKSRGGYSAEDRFEMLMTQSDEDGKSLLDDIYTTILKDAIHHSPKARSRFQSMMRQIFGTLEPLPMGSLNEMRRLFPRDEDHFKVELILESMAPLLSGTTDPNLPVRPLHASFRDFLTDQHRSGDFFVDLEMKEMDENLGFGTLRIMKHGLQFNICGLETSYLRNIEVPDLSERIKEHIPPHLSYSCRFFSTHIHQAAFDPRLAGELCSFFGSEQLVFWFEVLSLLGIVNGAYGALLAAMKYIEGRNDYSDTVAVVQDAQQFIRRFASLISQSTPHLYISALPFAPAKSVLASSIAPRLSRVARVVMGRDEDWPPVQLVLSGHRGAVCDVCVSPDGRWIASSSEDSTVRIWDMETGQPLGRPLEGHTSSVPSVSFSSDGQKIVSGSLDSTVRVWDVSTGTQIGSPLTGHQDRVTSIAISPTAPLIVSGSYDKKIIIWDIETHSQIAVLEGHEDGVTSLAISSDGARIVSGSADNTVRVWDIVTRLQVGVPFAGHTKLVRSVAWAPDGKSIASGSSDGTLRFWDAETCSQLGKPLDGLGRNVMSVVFSHDGRFLVSASFDETIRMWDVGSRTQIGKSFHADAVMSLTVSRDGNRIVSGSLYHTIGIWDTQHFQRVQSALEEEINEVIEVAFLEDNKHIVSAHLDRTIRTWDLDTGVPIDPPFVVPIAASAGALFVAKRWTVLGLADGSIQVWSFETHSQVGNTLLGHDDAVQSLAVSQDGTMIASGARDNTVRLWSTETWLPLGEPLRGHTDRVILVRFIPSSHTLVSVAKDSTVRLWDIQAGLPLGELYAPIGGDPLVSFWAIEPSPDGNYVTSNAMVADHRLGIFDLAQRTLIAELEGHDGTVRGAQFSPDGKHIVSGSCDKTVRIWDATTRVQVGAPLHGHTDDVDLLAFSPNGEWIVSGAWDGSIQLWNFKEALRLGSPLDSDNTNISSEQCHICLSPDPAHALRDPPSVAGITDWTDPVATDEDGWVLGPNDSRIVWIPPHWRKFLRFYGRIHRMALPRILELDLSEMAHGQAWQECWKS